MESIEKNNTWTLTKHPPGHKPIGLKWVFKLKKDSVGQIVKHKARLVAKRYVQQQANRSWEVHHMDVKSAFLNGELEEEVYVAQPEGFEVQGQKHLMYKLSKALYGLKQAPRKWNIRLDRSLKELGFRRCSQEQAVYTRGERGAALIVGVYVDDFIVTGGNTREVQLFKQQMMTEFEMSDLELLSYYLGIEVEQKKGQIKLKRSAYAKKILSQFGMS
ncbi:Retrovirus-related Pol polyprotein from transposon TNT 1-94-like protein [Drosera capensis]